MNLAPLLNNSPYAVGLEPYFDKGEAIFIHGPPHHPQCPEPSFLSTKQTCYPVGRNALKHALSPINKNVPILSSPALNWMSSQLIYT